MILSFAEVENIKLTSNFPETINVIQESLTNDGKRWADFVSGKYIYGIVKNMMSEESQEDYYENAAKYPRLTPAELAAKFDEIIKADSLHDEPIWVDTAHDMNEGFYFRPDSERHIY